MSGGGVADWTARDLEIVGSGEVIVPDVVKAPIILAGIVSLVYYLVVMIMTEHRTRDLYVSQLHLDRQLAAKGR